MAAIITFATTYALILPAITIEREHTDEVAGIYLEQKAEQDAMWEENALEPTDVRSADRENGYADTADGEELTDAPEVGTLKSIGSDYTVTLTYDETANIPWDAVLYVSEIAQDSDEYQTYLAEAKKAIGLTDEESLPSFAARFFDIKIMVGDEEFTPESGVSVEITYAEPLAENYGAEVSAVHFADESAEAEVIEASTTEVKEGESATVEFVAESFSVYGVVYTVDLHYEVNGKVYDFSMPGGGFVPLRHLVEMLGIGTEDTTGKFAADVESVEFSNPELVWVGKADEAATVGELKEANGIETEYSAELTDEQIEEINAQTVEAGDWVLISVQPFKSEETLTVTMKNGDQWTVKVTDAQISAPYLTDKGQYYEVTVIYDDDAQIPEGSTLKITEYDEGSKEYIDARNALLDEKLSKGEDVDPAFMGFSALDISILNADGDEIEPAAPVRVEMKIKALPGVEDLSSVERTLAVQHHVETEKGVVLETVFDGSTEASFVMDTDEAIAAEHTHDNTDNVAFTTSLFSTFTVTWGNANQTVSYLYATAAGVNTWQFTDDGNSTYTTYNTNNLYIMGTNQFPVSSGVKRSDSNGTATGDIYLVYTKQDGAEGDGTVSDADSSFHIYFTNSGRTYADVTVHYVDTEGNNIRRTGTEDVTYNGGSVDTRFASGTNSQSSLSGYAGAKSGYSNPQVLLGRPGSVTGPNATIHYVDRDGNELQVVHTTPSAVTGAPNYLIYDVEGYEYDYTYLNEDSVRIQPEIRYDNNKWQYVSGTHTDSVLVGPWQWADVLVRDYQDIAADDDIYVVYKKKETPSEGGKPLVNQDAAQPDAPNILKTSRENGNGTNTLSLSITGSRDPAEMLKLADVIVIFDRSGSMNQNMNGDLVVQNYGTPYSNWNQNSRIKQAYDAVDTFADTLLSKTNSNGDPLVRMSLVSFSNTATVDHGFTSDKDEFMEALQGLVGDGGTNWEDALYKANTTFKKAADENDVGEWDLDPNRATYVVFVTDGAPTFRLTRYDVDNGEFNEDILHGENGRDISTEMYINHYVFGAGDSDYKGYNYDGALEQASSITENKKILYSIGISGTESELKNLGQLLNEAGAGDDHNVVATDQETLKKAFNDIAQSILGQFGQANIVMNDGITPMTNTVEKANEEGRLEDAEGNFVYYKAKAPAGWADWTPEKKEAYNLGIKYQETGEKPDDLERWIDDKRSAYDAGVAAVFEEWTDRGETECGPATYENGAVKWNMGDKFMLEDGVTYRVSFICWPSQEAYDHLAKCRNDENYYDTLTPDQQAQILRKGSPGNYTYQLKTNEDHPTTSYYPAAINSGNVTTFGEQKELEFPTVPDMDLAERQINVQKLWVNDLDDRKYNKDIRLGVMGDGNSFASILLKKDDLWTGSAHISTGLMDVNDGEITLYETGHDFTLVEDEELIYHWELTADTYRPMVITDAAHGYNEPTPVILKKVTADDAYDYVIEGKYYTIESGLNALTAVNYRRSNLNLTKNIVAENGTTLLNDQHKDELFDFTITIHEANVEDLWFSVLEDPADETSLIRDLITNATAETNDAGNPTGYYHAMSGTEITVQLKPSWNLRFINLPIGSEFTVTETAKTDYTFYGATISPETGLEVDEDALTVTGTIDEANKQYVIDFKNQYQKLDVTVTKNWAGQAAPGSSTVMLYKIVGTKGLEDDPARPKDKIRVIVNTVPVPVVTNDGSIEVTYTGRRDDGSTVEGSYTLSNQTEWNHTFELERGLEYEFTYTPDTEQIEEVSPVKTEKITETTTVTLTPKVKEIPKYIYKFSVDGEKPTKGYVDVTCNGSTQRASALNDWEVLFEVAHGDVIGYSAEPDGKFVTGVELSPEPVDDPVTGGRNINMVLTKEDLTMTVPVTVNWGDDTPPSGTNVNVTFTPDKDGLEPKSITLNGSEDWNSSIVLERLDEAGDPVTWTVAVSDNQEYVEVSTPTDTICGEGRVDITGSVIPESMNLTIEAGNSVNSYHLYKVSYDNGFISYSTQDDIGPVPGYNNTTNFNNLPYEDSEGNDLYYGIVVWEGNINVQTDAPFAGYTTRAVEDVYTRRTVIYFRARPGDVTVKLTKGYSWNVEYGLSFNQTSSTSGKMSARRFAAAPAAKSAPGLKAAPPSGSTRKKFYDNSIQGASGDLPFTSIKYKDLPAGAEYVETKELTGNESYTWSGLQATDDNGNPIYYYVVEKDATARAETMDVTYHYEYIGGDSANGISKVTITNTTTCLEPKKTSVTLKKVDESDVNNEVITEDDLLDGAKFILEKYDELSPREVKDEEWCNAHSELNAGTGGVFTFTDLTAGIYRIVEKGYPGGYIQTSEFPAFEIYVEDEGSVEKLKIRLLDDAGGMAKLVDGELTIIFGNEPGAALPSTGGPGTTLFTILGSLLILGAGLLLARRLRPDGTRVR
ncbi:MAG: VWA domain-containing protein [Lachnospiraceae bacterium]|nr:VWA domain-containing protein [Lachnospiraceae bacterium]